MSSRMRVRFFALERMFGFCLTEDGRDVYFRADAFEGAPPPVAGEEVEVVLATGPSLRAASVRRLSPPERVGGVVTAFHPRTGWGFAQGDDGVTYFLHRCDVVGERAPSRGQRVEFFAGSRDGRPRACHVRV